MLVHTYYMEESKSKQHVLHTSPMLAIGHGGEGGGTKTTRLRRGESQMAIGRGIHIDVVCSHGDSKNNICTCTSKLVCVYTYFSLHGLQVHGYVRNVIITKIEVHKNTAMVSPERLKCEQDKVTF